MFYIDALIVLYGRCSHAYVCYAQRVGDSWDVGPVQLGSKKVHGQPIIKLVGGWGLSPTPDHK